MSETLPATADIAPQRGGEIRARKIGFPFSGAIPRHWFGGNPWATHLANGLNLLFPLGERFFVRSVRHYLDHVDDPALLAQVKGFIGQEVRHGLEHERFFEILSAQGFRVDRFLAAYEALAFRGLERLAPPKLRLSATVALEHLTATMAETALTKDLLQIAHPTMRDLFLWHAAEEIEHKAVAFDVLQRVDDSYALRIAGMLLAVSTLVPFWIASAVMLLAQDDSVTWRELLAARRRAKAAGHDRDDVGRAFLQYLRRDFHPSQVDNAHLARQLFERWTAARGDA